MRARWILRSALFVLVGLCLASASASPQVLKGSKAALNVKLGLWEQTTVVQMSGTPPMEPGTEKMSPEQKARLEAAMKLAKERAAVPHTHRSCLTQEKLDKSVFGDNEGSCRYTVVTNTARVYEVKTVCGGQQPSTGEWRFEALSPESVKGTGKITLGENKMTSTSTMTAKWIAASCGNVK